MRKERRLVSSRTVRTGTEKDRCTARGGFTRVMIPANGHGHSCHHHHPLFYVLPQPSPSPTLSESSNRISSQQSAQPIVPHLNARLKSYLTQPVLSIHPALAFSTAPRLPVPPSTAVIDEDGVSGEEGGGGCGAVVSCPRVNLLQ